MKKKLRIRKIIGNGESMTKEDWIKFTQIKSIEDLEKFVNRYNKGELIFQTKQAEISFLYNLGLWYSEYYEETELEKLIFRKEDKYYLPVYFYLKAIKIYEDNKLTIDKDENFLYEIVRRLYVNIANEYSNQFRTISALAYFRKALKIDDFFDMAIGNFAIAIEHHSPLLGLDESKYSLIFNFLYELYFDLHLDNLDSGKELFANKKLQYKKKQLCYFNSIVNGINANYNPYDFFTEIDIDCESYDNWCVKNTLYLNYINDLGDYEEVKFDIDLHKLNEILKLSDAQLHSLNNLFELFALQRKKIFECKPLSNREELYELAQVFQCLYSYFDKVAFFLFKYFHLMGKEHTVNINRIWDMKDEDGNSLMKYKNQYLYNIYWLRKEYRENAKDTLKINELLSPDAQDYADIRNTLEHKDFSFTQIEGLPYLNPDLLFRKTIKLAGVVRNMILSLVQMIDVERRLIDKETNKRNFDLVYFSYQGFV